MSAVESLASLHPPWAAAWAGRTPGYVFDVIAAGWGCIFRLSFLLATAQAGSASLFQALKMTHATFARQYPGYQDWLDRCGGLGVCMCMGGRGE